MSETEKKWSPGSITPELARALGFGNAYAIENSLTDPEFNEETMRCDADTSGSWSQQQVAYEIITRKRKS